MYHTILVPLDGSSFAEAALPVAAELAQRAGGRLVLALAHRPVLSLVPMAETALPAPSLEEEFRAGESEYLARTSRGLTGRVETRLLEESPGPALVTEAERSGAELIVMATHGRGAFGRLWLGSVADHVVRHAPVPVLLVRPGATGAGQGLRRGLVALDLSRESEAALDAGLRFARVAGAELTLLHVVVPHSGLGDPAAPFPMPMDPALLDLERAEAERRLDRAAEARGLPTGAGHRQVRIAPSAAAGILEPLESGDFDFAVVATHGRSGVRRLLLGSVADKVIRGAHHPVLVVRPVQVEGG